MNSLHNHGNDMAANESNADASTVSETTVRIGNESGFHVRAATLFASNAMKFGCDIRVRVGQRKVNGKGVMDLLTLGAVAGADMHIRAEGNDATEAIAALHALVEDNFGEDT